MDKVSEGARKVTVDYVRNEVLESAEVKNLIKQLISQEIDEQLDNEKILIDKEDILEHPKFEELVSELTTKKLNNDFPEVASKQNLITDNIRTLELVNYQVAELLRIKEELEARISALLEHGDEGSKTYVHEKWKVTVTSGYNYSLNKSEWEVLGSHIPKCFNFVTQRVSYDLNKSVIKDAEKYASPEELELISRVLSKKPKKLHIKISQGV